MLDFKPLRLEQKKEFEDILQLKPVAAPIAL